MIIDVHGHFTTAPKKLNEWRARQVALFDEGRPSPPESELGISDDELRGALEPAQLKLQRERGTDLALFSPTAGGMGHHIGNAETSQAWTEVVNNLIYRVCNLYPENFVGVCQLPQSPGVSPESCIAELERCVTELGFVGCNLSPDPTGGFWLDPPMTDHYWYPLYEKLVELDVPAMIHVSGTANKNFHITGSHYLNADTAVFMQCVQANLFGDFPSLRFVIPHGGGAVPYHWGRYRGIAQDLGQPPLEEHLLENIFFDTCVYHQEGMATLARVLPPENVIFASEMIGAVRSIDPRTGEYFDDTKRYIDALTELDEDARSLIFEGNALRVYPRLQGAIDRQRGSLAV
jgi:4-oxalmesaconate hydratase